MRIFLILLLTATAIGCTTPVKTPPQAPPPLVPVPYPNQLAWQEMELNMFVHFNMNTFTNKEWGFGDESPSQFNPADLDCRQWARIAKAAGMKGIILTAKHHDGFCLWPSEYTNHSVKNSPWKEGRGDVVQELREACDEYGLKMGLYLSPWDRNHPDYGKPEYVMYFRNQATELLTRYGEVFEFWVDGANGGDGYYGGANEMRQVDRQSYYDWDSTFSLIQSLQPNTVIFSDAGPGCRWVGNEEGWANPTNWSTLNLDGLYPGTPDYKQLTSGHQGGTSWVPAEVNTSIRPGWYYHPEEDSLVKSLEKLQEIYDNSVGRNGLLLLNIPMDTRGQVHPNDSARLMELSDWIVEDRRENLATNSSISVSNTRSAAQQFAAKNLIDEEPATYWAVDDTVSEATVTIEFTSPTSVRLVTLEEVIELGQRVENFSIEGIRDEKAIQLHEGTTIGYRRMIRFAPMEVDAVRITIEKSLGPILLKEIGLY